jgi:hypothetical protein
MLIEAVPPPKHRVFIPRARGGKRRRSTGRRSRRGAAEKLGLSLVPALIEPASEPEYREVFATLPEVKVDALLLGDGAEHHPFPKLLGELTLAFRIPSLFPDRSFADAGGMMSYGADFPDLFRHAGDNSPRYSPAQSRAIFPSTNRPAMSWSST